MMDSSDKITVGFLVLWLCGFLAWVAVVAGIIFTAIHFVKKLW